MTEQARRKKIERKTVIEMGSDVVRALQKIRNKSRDKKS